jgi:hypothetical protein
MKAARDPELRSILGDAKLWLSYSRYTLLLKADGLRKSGQENNLLAVEADVRNIDDLVKRIEGALFGD